MLHLHLCCARVCVQDGFDEFLDEFLVRAADGNGLNAEQIEAFLDNLSCKCTASEVQDILDEGLGSQVVKDKDQSITIAALWAKSDTFWEILKAADAKEVGQDNENGEKLQPLRQNKTVLRRKVRSTARHVWRCIYRLPSIASSQSSPLGKHIHTGETKTTSWALQAMVASRELVVGAFNSFANGGRRMKVSAMKEASKSLGEFGAPLFKQIFKEKYLEDRVSLT